MSDHYTPRKDLVVDWHISLSTLIALFVQTIVLAFLVGIAYTDLNANIEANRKVTTDNRERIVLLEARSRDYENLVARLEERMLSTNANVLAIKELLNEIRAEMQGRRIPPK